MKDQWSDFKSMLSGQLPNKAATRVTTRSGKMTLPSKHAHKFSILENSSTWCILFILMPCPIIPSNVVTGSYLLDLMQKHPSDRMCCLWTVVIHGTLILQQWIMWWKCLKASTRFWSQMAYLCQLPLDRYWDSDCLNPSSCSFFVNNLVCQIPFFAWSEDIPFLGLSVWYLFILQDFQKKSTCLFRNIAPWLLKFDTAKECRQRLIK